MKTYQYFNANGENVKCKPSDTCARCGSRLDAHYTALRNCFPAMSGTFYKAN